MLQLKEYITATLKYASINKVLYSITAVDSSVIFGCTSAYMEEKFLGEGSSLHSSAAEHLQCPLGHPDEPHAVVDPTRPQPTLCYLEAPPFSCNTAVAAAVVVAASQDRYRISSNSSHTVY